MVELTKREKELILIALANYMHTELKIEDKAWQEVGTIIDKIDS